MTTQIKTQCPNCSLYFDLPTQLTPLLHQPNTPMRCGHCQHHFIINEHLIVSATDSSSVSHKDLASKQDTENSWLEELLYNVNGSNAQHRDHLLNAKDKGVERRSDELLTSAILAESHTFKNSVQSITSKQAFLQNDSLVDSSKRASYRYDEEARSIATVLWIAGCLLLVLALFAQYVIFNLNTLLKNPDHAARLETVCTIAVCSLPAANLDAFMISDLNFAASKIEASNKFTDIQATLENNSTQTQLLPSLKVTLYNNDSVLGEFIALPEDYLIGRQEQLAAGYGKPFIFTTAISATQVSKVTVKAIY